MLAAGPPSDRDWLAAWRRRVTLLRQRGPTMDRERLRAQLVADEGCVLHAYQDHLGFWTIGIGRLIDRRRGGGISRAEAEMLLDNDIARVCQALDRAIPWWRGLSAQQQEALVNMGFQLGVAGLLMFRRMLAALERGDGEAARTEALDSRWARQTPARAARVAEMLSTG